MPANLTHPAIPQPATLAIPIWRYMNFAKYVSMLQAKGLHLAQLGKLGDPFEGSLSRIEYEQIVASAKAAEASGTLPDEWKGNYFDVVMDAARRARLENYISCWHMNSGESEAMWRLYSSSGYSIAVQSTYELLGQSLPTFVSGEYVGPLLGVVRYVDHHRETMPTGNGFHPVMHKLRSFEHEKECRVVLWRAGKGPSQVPLDLVKAYPAVINLPVPLDSLIQSVLISPTAPAWFLQTVRDVTKAYGHHFEVRQSSLLQPPYL